MLYGDELAQAYLEHFDIKCRAWPSFGRQTLHNLFGSLVNIRSKTAFIGDNEIDLRSHSLILAPSASGKGEGFNVHSEFAILLGLSVQVVDSFTDKTLIGSIEVDMKAKRAGQRNYFKYHKGWLDPARGKDILVSNEGSLVLDSRINSHTRATIIYLTKAMNTIGSYDQRITTAIGVGDSIEFNPTCSLLLESYIPDQLLKVIASMGFIQRMLVNIQPYPRAMRKKFSKAQAKSINVRREPAHSKEEIVQSMLNIDDHYADHDLPQVPDSLVEDISKVPDRFWRAIERHANGGGDILDTFCQRYINYFYRHMIHHAMFRCAEEVSIEDIRYAFDDIFPMWKTVIEYIGLSVLEEKPDDPELKQRKMILEAYKHTCRMKRKTLGTWVPISEFIVLYSGKKYLDTSIAFAVRPTEDAIKEGLLDSKIIEKTRYVRPIGYGKEDDSYDGKAKN